ncbi:MAG: hypothetical protein JST00_25930 [Deltaproteobacteria bacterium]|nr:hypothetical protein [Deltaproteobacteria bacterium]
MNRLGLALALAFASITAVACAAPTTEEGQDAKEVATNEGEGNVQSQQQELSCRRFPKDTCVSVGTYCRNHGGELWCDLQGYCVCRYPVIGTVQKLSP